MVKDCRVTYRRRHSYNTASNKTKVVKTPGGRLLVQYLAKSVGAARCGETGKLLAGVARQRVAVNKNLPGYRRSVSRAYGGVLSHSAVRDRVLRAFILDEKKLVKAKVATATEEGAAPAQAPAKDEKAKKPAKKAADTAKAPAAKAAEPPKAAAAAAGKGKGKQ